MVPPSGAGTSTSVPGGGGSGSTGLPPGPPLGGSLGLGGSVGMDTTSGNAGMAGGCNDLTVETKPVVPTVLLLVDNSSSMFEPRDKLWDPLYNVLMNATSGIVPMLQSKVRFGFAAFRGSNMQNDPACPNLFEVDYKLDNYDAINKVYTQQSNEWMPGAKWETPTGAAIKKAATKLVALEVDPPGPKYIVLVTDGNPNTCATLDPQCASDESVKAVQDAKAMGVGTFAVGIGDIVSGNAGCDKSWGRCGADHLQDLANAGQGLPVQAPPADLRYQPCYPSQMLSGTYAAATDTPGKAPYFTAANPGELQTALTGLLNSVVSCTYDMNAMVVGDPALGTVKIDDNPVAYNDPNGWKLEDNKVQITLVGAACTKFKSMAGQQLSVSFPCKVAVPKPPK